MWKFYVNVKNFKKKFWGKIKEIVTNNAGVSDKFELNFVEILGKQWANLGKNLGYILSKIYKKIKTLGKFKENFKNLFAIIFLKNLR